MADSYSTRIASTFNGQAMRIGCHGTRNNAVIVAKNDISCVNSKTNEILDFDIVFS